MSWDWEGLYVALSRVKYRDHIRLAINRDRDDLDMEYMADLKKNKYTDCFFSGFEQSIDSEARIWNRNLALKAAGFDKSGDTHLHVYYDTSKRSKKGR